MKCLLTERFSESSYVKIREYNRGLHCSNNTQVQRGAKGMGGALLQMAGLSSSVISLVAAFLLEAVYVKILVYPYTQLALGTFAV